LILLLFNLVGKLLLLNHEKDTFTVVSEEMEKSASTEEMINLLMNSPRTSTFLSDTNMEYKRVRAGFWGWQYDKVEEIAGYQTEVYDITGIDLISQVNFLFFFFFSRIILIIISLF